MDFKNVLLAIVLSTAVLIGWATFFEAPIVEQQSTENTITKNEDLSSPSIDEEDKTIENKINTSRENCCLLLFLRKADLTAITKSSLPDAIYLNTL